MSSRSAARLAMRRATGVVLVSGIVALSACSSDDASPSDAGTVGAGTSPTTIGTSPAPTGSSAASTGATGSVADAGSGTSGGELTFVSNGDLTCVDPWQTNARSSLQWQRLLQDSLLYENEAGEIFPWLAASYEVNEDATEFRFELRPDVTFSDGSVLDSEVVKANLDVLAEDPAYVQAKGFMGGYVGTTAEGPSTVVVEFETPNAPFLYAMSIPHLSITSLESAGLSAADRCSGIAAGSGSYTIADLRAGEQVVLTRNPDYAWQPESLENQGPGYLDTITVNFVADPAIIAQTGLAGEADIVQGVEPTLIDQLTGSGWSFFDVPEAGTSGGFIVYPGRGIAGNDLAVRRAIALAIDAEEVNSPLGPVARLASGVLSSGHPYYTDQSAMVGQDVAAAQAVLDEAGWLVGDDGIRQKDGQRLAIEVLSYSFPVAIDMVSIAAEQLRAVGIEMTIVPVTFAEESARLAAGDVEIRHGLVTGAETSVIQLLWGDALPEEAAEAIAATTAIVDRDARQAAVDEAANILVEDGWFVPMMEGVNQPFRSGEVQGVVSDVGGLYMLAQVWLGEAG